MYNIQNQYEELRFMQWGERIWLHKLIIWGLMCENITYQYIERERDAQSLSIIMR